MSECVPVETVVGLLYVRADQLVVGRFLQADGRPPTETEARAFIEKWVGPGDMVIDVGCNVGFFTALMSELVGSRGHVAALDPNPSVLACLAKTVGRRMLVNVKTRAAAAGSADGWGRIDFDPRGDGGTRITPSSRTDVSAHVIALDTIPNLRRPVAFIKIDAEGMDHEVLLGARAILTEDRPVVLFEHNPEQIEARGQQPGAAIKDVVDLCADVGYTVTYPDGRPAFASWTGDLALIPKEKLNGSHG